VGYRLRDFLGLDRQGLLGVAGAAVALLAATLVSYFYQAALGVEFAYYLYLVAVVICAFVGGLLSGLLATFVSALTIAWLLLAPVYSPAIAATDERWRLVQFLVEGSWLSVLGQWLRSGKHFQSEKTATRYGFAVLLAATVVILKLLALQTVGTVAPFSLCFAAVVASTWMGGTGPGLLTTILLAAAGLLLFIAPVGAFTEGDPHETVRVILFVAEAIVLTAMVSVYRAARLTAIKAYGEAALRAELQQRRIAAVFEAMPVGMALIDRDLGIYRCNGAFARLCRVTRAELENAPLHQFVAATTTARLKSEIAAILDAPHGTVTFDAKWLEDGETSVTARLVALPELEGGPIHAGLMCEDTTERLRTQAELKESQSLLRQAEKMEAVGRLAGGIAHDFNNLLAVIIGYAGILANRLPESDPRRTDVQEIGKAADRAATLTRQLLAFSRRQMHQPEVTSLNDIVNGTSRLLRRLIGEHIELDISVDPNLSPVVVDRSQMELVLLNLAANARDAMPHGGVLTIRTANAARLAAPEDEGVSLTVGDTGVGIAEEHKPHIFEPFYTTKEVGKGTGLGLSTVYGIVKQSRGEIEVESVPQAGTRFRIWLPRARETGNAARTIEIPAPKPGSGTIMLVEDEEGLRKLLTRVLEGQGYSVVPARTGAEALELAASRQEPVQLLLTDVVMPGFSGVALAEQLRALWPEMKMLFISGHTPEAQRAIGGYVPDSNFLAKPFTPDTILRRIAELLDSR
jgi:PAS domain S-box-containing protein